jgi:hypothetical protein
MDPKSTPSAEPKGTATLEAPDPGENLDGGEHLSDGMRELEQMASDDTPRPAPKPKKPAVTDPKKPTDPKTPPKEAAEPEDPTAEIEEEPQGTDPKPPEKPVKAAELRTAYEKSKADLKTKDAEITKLKTELKAAQEAPRNDPEKKLLVEKFEASEKKRQALEQELRVVAYQKSEEFIEKYDKPWNEAWEQASTELSELMIESEDGSSRVATVKDLQALLHLPPVDARKFAKAAFGEAADEVMAHYRKLKDLAAKHTKAIKDSEANAETYHKEREAKTVAERQRTVTLWQDANKVWPEKFPSFFAPKEGDEQGNALLAKGYELADRAFSGNGNLTPEERVKLHAEVRNKAAAFPRVALDLKRARARIKELEASLAQFEDSEPPAGDGGRGRKVKPASNGIAADMQDGYDELDRMAKVR